MDYTLPTPEHERTKGARIWLLSGIGSLALAGFFAILLVCSRTPGVQAIFPWKDMFHTALVVHVNLSVLVWLMAFTAFLWRLAMPGACRLNFGAWMGTAGTLLIAASPFLGEGTPLMNNYVPILQNHAFFLGLAVFAGGILYEVVQSLHFMFIPCKDTPKCELTGASKILHFAIGGSVLMVLIMLVCFGLAGNELAKPEVRALFNPEDFYEKLFWGGGHVLQFVYVQIMLVCWLWMASHLGLSIRLSGKAVASCFAFNLLAVVLSPSINLTYSVLDFEYVDLFTKQMQWGGGVAAAVIGLALGLALWQARGTLGTSKPVRNALFTSLLLFAAGGGLAMMIDGVNAIIPAHYHGSIVAVTLSFIGLSYVLFPKLGYGTVTGRMAAIQPIFYGGGQLLHIIGLAWSGGYGAMRKTPGAAPTFEAQMGMGLMGLGGLLSIIGGLLFVIVAAKAIFGKKQL